MPLLGAVTVALLLPLASSIQVDEEARMWKLQDGVSALDLAIVEINRVLHNPNVTSVHLNRAKKLTQKIVDTVDAVENNKISKAKADEINHAAVAELASFEKDVAAANSTQDKLAVVNRMLAEKQRQIAKSEAEAELLNLEMERKEKAEALRKVQDRKAENKLVRSLTSVHLDKATDSSTSKQSADASLQSILREVQAHEQRLSKELAKLQKEQEETDDKLDSAVRNAIWQPGSASDRAKRQVNLRAKKADEQRKFQEAHNTLQGELDNLKEAETSIRDHDLKKLRKAFSKMKSRKQ